MSIKILDEYDLGITDYTDAVSLQERLTDRRKKNKISDVLLITEHNPVVTIGRFMKPGDLETELTVSQDKILELGIAVTASDRGGRLTYHGPGQLVAYPIVHLQESRLSIKQYVWMLEESIIGTLDHFGIASQRRESLTGVWVGENKIAALGLRVIEGVSRHGIALNVDIDLLPFGWIVPCGIATMGVTSMAGVLGGTKVFMSDVKRVFIDHMARVFNRDIRPSGGIRECLSLL